MTSLHSAEKNLSHRVADTFAEGGLLSRLANSFHVRDGQVEMAMAVSDQIEKGGALVVEAGTGVGKTYAYLVPSLLCGERILISTATKALQDQLFKRDIPTLVNALGLPIRLALLKGRSNYLCTHRLRQSQTQALNLDRWVRMDMVKIQIWAQQTLTGDLSEVDGLNEQSKAIEWVTSTRDNCLGSICPDFRTCHVVEARRKALSSDVVVINHHLFFADIAVRESGVAEFLPASRVVVFDEAHQLNETGVVFLGKSLSNAQLMDLRRDTLVAGLQMARGMADWNGLCIALEKSARDWRLAMPKQVPGGRLGWEDSAPEGCHPEVWQQVMSDVAVALSNLATALDSVSEIAPDFLRLNERTHQLGQRVAQFFQPAADSSVRWLEINGQVKCVESPLDIAEVIQSKLMTPLEAQNEAQASKTWIFTSATLGDEPTLKWFTQPVGLADARILRVESPFDYPAQSLLHVPSDFPKPLDPRHSMEVAFLAATGARLLGGRTLILTTSLRAMTVIGEQLIKAFTDDPSIDVLIQGQWPKRRLMERFRQGDREGLPGCVMVASASFWEGFDVPGESLQLLIIDKLPFPAPSDPLVKARSKNLESNGGNAFNDHALPEAIVTLKQGAGRLIRNEADRGGVLIADTRMRSASYGERIFSALPNMRRIDQTDLFWNELSKITRVSTKVS